MDKVTRQCPQTAIFEEKKESRTDSNRGPSAYQPNALPLGQTGSQEEEEEEEGECWFYLCLREHRLQTAAVRDSWLYNPSCLCGHRLTVPD